MIQTIEHDNKKITGYLAVPPQSGAGVLVCHAWWGLTPFFTHICDRLAVQGFVAFAPDYFKGETAVTIEKAKILRGKAERKQAKIQTRTALDFLVNHPSVTRSNLGAVGFSYGCGFALEAARLRPKLVNSVVVFYGTGGGKFDKTAVHVQGHFAEKDEWGATPQKAEKLKQKLLGADQEATFYVYPEMTHWFFESNNEAYSEQPATLAWNRTIDFLKQQLRTT